MKKITLRPLIIGVALLVAFVVFTICVMSVDVRPIGPDGTSVGFAKINSSVRDSLGTNNTLYKISEVLGLLTWGVVAVFGLLGLYQLICRKSLLKVDRDILVLGGGYAVMLALYVLFDKVAINYRPASSLEEMEASYPSSHTLMLVFVMATAVMQIVRRISNKTLRTVLVIACVLTAVAVIACRALCGVHWITDIVGGLLLAASLAALYRGLAYADEQP